MRPNEEFKRKPQEQKSKIHQITVRDLVGANQKMDPKKRPNVIKIRQPERLPPALPNEDAFSYERLGRLGWSKEQADVLRQSFGIRHK